MSPGSGSFTALSGDATSTSTGGATSVVKVNGGSISATGALQASNSSHQLVDALTPPTANGVYPVVYNVTGGVAVAPTAAMAGLVPRSVGGTTSTDTILYSDNNETVEYQGSVAVAVTLPTATTLGNSHLFTILSNLTTGSSTAVTVTPTTWTINGGATLVIAQGQTVRVSVDPSSSTNWLATAIEGPLSAGSNITLTRTAAGTSVSVSGTVPTATTATGVAAGSSTMTVAGPTAPRIMTVPDAAFTVDTTTTTKGLAYGGTNVDLSAAGAAHDFMAQNASHVITSRVIAVGDLPVLYGQCTEAWGGSGTSFAMTSGDDAIVNNTCYNDSGATRTITVVKCRGDNAANSTALTPTFGASGTGTAILTGTVTCGNSYAYSSTGTVTNASWTTGTGIDPGMSTVGNATSIALLIEYTYQPF